MISLLKLVLKVKISASTTRKIQLESRKKKTAIVEIDLKHPIIIIIKMKCKQNIFKNCSIGLTLASICSHMSKVALRTKDSEFAFCLDIFLLSWKN